MKIALLQGNPQRFKDADTALLTALKTAELLLWCTGKKDAFVDICVKARVHAVAPLKQNQGLRSDIQGVVIVPGGTVKTAAGDCFPSPQGVQDAAQGVKVDILPGNLHPVGIPAVLRKIKIVHMEHAAGKESAHQGGKAALSTAATPVDCHDEGNLTVLWHALPQKQQCREETGIFVLHHPIVWVIGLPEGLAVVYRRTAVQTIVFKPLCEMRCAQARQQGELALQSLPCPGVLDGGAAKKLGEKRRRLLRNVTVVEMKST